MATEIDPRLVGLTAPDSYAADQYRRVQMELEKRHGAERGLVVGIASPLPGDGKSLTAVNLAAVMARRPGARVILIDADVRQGSRELGRRLLLDAGSPGLVDLVAGRKPTIHQVGPNGLHVMLSGGKTTAPTELFQSERFANALEEMRNRYDFVVIDTAPAVPVADCSALAPRVDGFLVVIAAHKTPRATLAQTLDVIGQEKVFGLVFNRDDQSLADHYAYAYDYYG